MPGTIKIYIKREMEQIQFCPVVQHSQEEKEGDKKEGREGLCRKGSTEKNEHPVAMILVLQGEGQGIGQETGPIMNRHESMPISPFLFLFVGMV